MTQHDHSASGVADAQGATGQASGTAAADADIVPDGYWQTLMWWMREGPAMIRDARRYRWLRSDGLGHVRWEGLTTETCDVGLDFAIDRMLDATGTRQQ